MLFLIEKEFESGLTQFTFVEINIWIFGTCLKRAFRIYLIENQKKKPWEKYKYCNCFHWHQVISVFPSKRFFLWQPFISANSHNTCFLHTHIHIHTSEDLKSIISIQYNKIA